MVPTKSKRRISAAWSRAAAALVIMIWGSGATAADKADGLEPVRKMERRYRAAKTLQATFLERYTEGDRTVRVESGTAFFRRPGKMRWEYAAPENNLFLIDGKTAWFYVPADHTVTRVPAKQSTDWRTPLALLAGETKVSRVCSRIVPATDVSPDGASDQVFRCTLRAQLEDPADTGAGNPKHSPAASNRQAPTRQGFATDEPASSAGDTVLLEIDKDTGALTRILVKDKGGIGIEFKFKNWVDDPVVAEALFHFQVPEGVAIVNGELPAENTR
jgi:outer membrane lipoprotein-sorting protein